MRRKSERTSTKKGKSSPEKKVEKVKRTRTSRRKQSTSSENESGEDASAAPEVMPVVEEEVVKKPPVTPVKEDSPEEAQSVWHVKSTESSGDLGEIKKLKICLTRPPSTPERADRSPRSRRKHSRATSSSDTASVEPLEDRRKSRRSKRMARESQDDSDKNHDSHGEEHETESEQPVDKSDNEISQSTETHEEKVSDETPMSTTNEEGKDESEKSVVSTASEDVSQNKETKHDSDVQSKSPDADTTVTSPRTENQDNQPGENVEKETQSEATEKETSSTTTVKENQSESKTEEKHKSESNTEKEQSKLKTDSESNQEESKTPERDSKIHERSETPEKSEILELHAEETKCETSESELSKVQNESKGERKRSRDDKEATRDKKVSNIEEKSDKTASKKTKSSQNDRKSTNEPDVVESSVTIDKERRRNMSTDSEKEKEGPTDLNKSRDLDRSDSTQSVQEEAHNGQAPPLVISRKRRWGSSRTAKLTTQKSITISTDILKEIIPDVKPVEFEEVIEEKKPYKREVTEKVERPILPKIVIDNTESVEQHKRKAEERDKENVKMRESNLAMNRKISIVKENDSILTRPPSPPRYKQSNILYITNLVRPFTLPQLKNLLQRTGRISENGFWIDKIKSKCFVKYETEDQAVETRHALHGVTWPVSNPKALQVDFSTQDAFDKAKLNEDTDNAQASTIPGTVEDWLREQDMKRERGELDKPWERKAAMREWDVGKNDKDKEKDKLRKDDRPLDKRRHHTPERSPEPAKKFKKKEEEAPAKLLDDLFRKTKTTPCIYWLPLSAETIAIKEEQRRQHMAEHERRLQELRRTGHRRH